MEYENSKNEFYLLRPSRWGLRFPKPSLDQILRLFIMASISFSQRQQAVGKRDVFVFAVFENCGFMKNYSLHVDLFSDLTALAVFSFDRTVEIMNCEIKRRERFSNLL